MSTQFTPGPWNVQRDGQIWCDDHPIAERITTGPWGDRGIFPDGTEVLVHHWGDVATDEAKANAHLIAAAPELYEAAERGLEWVIDAANSCRPEKDDAVFENAMRDLRRIEKVLAKARGDLAEVVGGSK